MFKKLANSNYTLLLLLTIQLVFQLIVFKNGFSGASGDDFFRALMAYEWKEAPFLVTSSFGSASVIWFPTHFWMGGAIYFLTDNLVFSLTSLSLTFSIVELIVLFYLTKLLFNKEAALIAILLVGFLPWQVWLGISMTEMTIYYATVLGAFLFFMEWKKEHRSILLLTSSVLFLFTTMLRPEGWIFAGLFSGYLACRIISGRVNESELGYIIVSMILPSLFILLWLGYNFNEFGNPLYFVKANKQNVEYHLDLTSLKIYVKSLHYLFLMFIVSPVIFLLASVSLLQGTFSFVRFSSLQRSYLLFALLQLLLITIISLFGPGTIAAPQRYAFINLLLLVPFAAYLLTQLWKKKYGYIIVVFIFSIHLGMSITKSFYYPEIFNDTITVGKYLKNDFKEGRVSNSEQVCSELAFQHIIGQSLHIRKDYLSLTSTHAALEVHAGRPRNFLFNVLKINEKDLLVDLPTSKQGSENTIEPTSSDKIKTKLEQMKVKKIILQDRRLMNRVPSNFHFERMIGTHAIFSTTPFSQPQSFEEPDNKFHLIDKEYTHGIYLKSYKYEGSLLPHTLSLVWKIDKNFLLYPDYLVKIKFKFLDDPHVEFERSVKPIFYWYKMEGITDSIYINDNIPLLLPPGMAAGSYSVEIALVEDINGRNKHQGDRFQYDEKKVELAPVTLYSSKRDVLINFFKNPEANWKLLAKTLLLL